jgi:ribose transport system permease protein
MNNEFPGATATPESHVDEPRGPLDAEPISHTRQPWLVLLERYGGVILLLALIAFFSIDVGSKFFNWDNFVGIISTQAIAGIIALGLIIPLASGVFDLSVGGVMTLSIVVVTSLISAGTVSVPVAIVMTLLMGALVGFINGTLVTRFNVDSLIATLGSSSIMLGLASLVGGGETVSSNIPTSFTDIARNSFIGKLPMTVLYVSVLGLVLWYIFDYTPLGRKIYATGAARETARLAGVKVRRVIIGSFIACAAFAALAGVLYASSLGAGPPEAGSAFLLPSFSAAFLGATIIKPGRFNVPGLVVAVFIVAIGINGLQLMGAAFWIVNVFQGGALLGAVVISQVRARRG